MAAWGCEVFLGGGDDTSSRRNVSLQGTAARCFTACSCMFGASVPNFTVHAADGPQFIIMTFANDKMKARSSTKVMKKKYLRVIFCLKMRLHRPWAKSVLHLNY